MCVYIVRLGCRPTRNLYIYLHIARRRAEILWHCTCTHWNRESTFHYSFFISIHPVKKNDRWKHRYTFTSWHRHLCATRCVEIAPKITVEVERADFASNKRWARHHCWRPTWGSITQKQKTLHSDKCDIRTSSPLRLVRAKIGTERGHGLWSKQQAPCLQHEDWQRRLLEQKTQSQTENGGVDIFSTQHLWD